MEALIPVIFVAFFILVVIGIIYAQAQAKKRREDLARIATEINMRYDANDPFDIANRYEKLSTLNHGHNRSANNVIHGKVGDRPVKVFDFIYHTTETSTDSQGHTTTSEVAHYFSAAIFDMDVFFPALLIRPEGFLDKIAAAIGFDDIDFESAEFSSKFYVKSDDKKFAYDIVHARMMEFLLENPGWIIQLEARSAVATSGGTFSPDQFAQAIDFVDAFLKQVPEFLWKQLRER